MDVLINCPRQVHYLWNSATFPVYRNTKTKYYRNGEEMYPDMLEALCSAKHYIFMEYFIIEPGTMWDGILAILKEKARMGVDVRLIYDDLGCLNKLRTVQGRAFQNGIKCEVLFGASVIYTVNKLGIIAKFWLSMGVSFTGGINLTMNILNVEVHWLLKDAGIREG
jgi:cardiolipin synthase